MKRFIKQAEYEEGTDLGGDASQESTVAEESAPLESSEPAAPKTALEAVEHELLKVAPETEKNSEEAIQAEPNKEDKKPENLRELRTSRDTLKAEKEHIESTLNAIRETVQEAGVNATEFRGLLDYARAVKQGNFESALQVLDAQRAALARAMGRELPGVDLLSGHQDLAQQVQAQQLPRSHALELAQAREAQSQQQAWLTQQQQTQQAQQQAQAQTEQAINQIGELSNQWAKSDPDYAAKEAILLKYLPQIRQNFPPVMWANQVGMLYQTLNDARQVSKSPSALRAGAGAGSRTPRSALEAVEMHYEG